MNDELSKINELWRSVGYFGAGFVASQTTKAITENTIEDHVEAEIYHGGNRAKSNQNTKKATLISGLVGSVFGAITGHLSKGHNGIIGSGLMLSDTMSIADNFDHFWQIKMTTPI